MDGWIDSRQARGVGINVEGRCHLVDSYRHSTPLSTSFVSCNASLHAAIGQRPYCGYKAAETMMRQTADSSGAHCSVLTHARRPEHTTLFVPPVARAFTCTESGWVSGKYGRRPRMVARMPMMKAIIMDLTLNFHVLIIETFSQSQSSETSFYPGTCGDCRLQPGDAPPCNYPLASPDEMMQAAGIDDRSYSVKSVRHGGGAQRIACFSAPGIFAYRVQTFTRDFTVNFGRCQC